MQKLCILSEWLKNGQYRSEWLVQIVISSSRIAEQACAYQVSDLFYIRWIRLQWNPSKTIENRLTSKHINLWKGGLRLPLAPSADGGCAIPLGVVVCHAKEMCSCFSKLCQTTLFLNDNVYEWTTPIWLSPSSGTICPPQVSTTGQSVDARMTSLGIFYISQLTPFAFVN